MDTLHNNSDEVWRSTKDRIYCLKGGMLGRAERKAINAIIIIPMIPEANTIRRPFGPLRGNCWKRPGSSRKAGNPSSFCMVQCALNKIGRPVQCFFCICYYVIKAFPQVFPLVSIGPFF